MSTAARHLCVRHYQLLPQQLGLIKVHSQRKEELHLILGFQRLLSMCLYGCARKPQRSLRVLISFSLHWLIALDMLVWWRRWLEVHPLSTWWFLLWTAKSWFRLKLLNALYLEKFWWTSSLLPSIKWTFSAENPQNSSNSFKSLKFKWVAPSSAQTLKSCQSVPAQVPKREISKLKVSDFKIWLTLSWKWSIFQTETEEQAKTFCLRLTIAFKLKVRGLS